MQGARDIALDALMQVERANAWSDEGLRRGITRGGLDSRDAALAARIAYGVMQNRMLLDFYIGCWCSQKVARLEPVIRNILRVGAYQILFLDKVPQHAAVSEAVEMTRQHGRPKAAGMVNAILRRIGANREHMPELPHESPEEYLSVRYSHPRWLVRRLLELLGPEEAEEYLRLDNEPVPTCIQTNFLKTDAPHLERELRGAGLNVQAHPWLAGCFLVTGTGDLEKLPAFREGRFMVQDAAARLVSLVAAPGVRSSGAAKPGLYDSSAAARTPPETSAALPKSVRNAAQPRPVRGSCPAQTTLPPLMSRCSRPPAWTAPSAARTLSVTRSAYCTRGRSGKHGSRSSSRPE